VAYLLTWIEILGTMANLPKGIVGLKAQAVRLIQGHQIWRDGVKAQGDGVRELKWKSDFSTRCQNTLHLYQSAQITSA
jgi:hypothetical protein